MNFVHTGNEVLEWIPSETQYWYLPESKDYRICAFPESADCINSLKVHSIEDHSIFLGEAKGHCNRKD